MPPNSTTDEPLYVPHARGTRLAAALIFFASLALTGLYNLIAGGTYDYDEFVYLLLGRGVSAGKLPYRDFLFYHPPGILVVMAALQPLIHEWWASGRILSLLLTAGTCSLVYLTARRFQYQTVAIVAALLCACNPILLVTGTRILPDVYVMFFTFLGIYVLMIGSSVFAGERLPSSESQDSGAADFMKALRVNLTPAGLRRLSRECVDECFLDRKKALPAVLAGISFGIGFWFKYPAALVVPAALLLARRRSPIFLLSMGVTILLLFSPFLSSFTHMYDDTVVYQQSRFVYPVGIRLSSILLFAVLLQPLAIFGLFVRPIRWWLVAGYLSAFLYVASSQVYYHYMLPVVPFASILGALYLSRLPRLDAKKLLLGGGGGAVAVTLLWALIMTYTPGDYPFHITSAQTANVSPVAEFIDRNVAPGHQILDDQPDLPVLSYRPNCDDYFWSDSTVISHSQLQFCLLSVRYIVHFFGGGSGFPPGFLLAASDGSGIAPGAVNDKYRRVVVDAGAYGAYVYETRDPAPYIPSRD